MLIALAVTALAVDLVPTPLVVEVLLGDLDLVHIHHADDVIVEAITTTDIPAIGMEGGTDVDIRMTGIAMVANILTVMIGIAPVPQAVVPQAVIITPDPDRTLRTVARKDVDVDHDQALDHVPALILLPVEDVTTMIRGHPAGAHRLSFNPLAMARRRRTPPDRPCNRLCLQAQWRTHQHTPQALPLQASITNLMSLLLQLSIQINLLRLISLLFPLAAPPKRLLHHARSRPSPSQNMRNLVCTILQVG